MKWGRVVASATTMMVITQTMMKGSHVFRNPPILAEGGMEGEREGGMEGERERGREGERKGGRKGGKERKGRREGEEGKEGGREGEGGRKRGRKDGREGEGGREGGTGALNCHKKSRNYMYTKPQVELCKLITGPRSA